METVWMWFLGQMLATAGGIGAWASSRMSRIEDRIERAVDERNRKLHLLKEEVMRDRISEKAEANDTIKGVAMKIDDLRDRVTRIESSAITYPQLTEAINPVYAKLDALKDMLNEAKRNR